MNSSALLAANMSAVRIELAFTASIRFHVEWLFGGRTLLNKAPTKIQFVPHRAIVTVCFFFNSKSTYKT